MKINYSLIYQWLALPAAVTLALLAAGAARAADFHVAAAQDLQNALTTAAGNGANNNIFITNGYYSGNFNYSSSAGYSLVVSRAGLDQHAHHH